MNNNRHKRTLAPEGVAVIEITGENSEQLRRLIAIVD